MFYWLLIRQALKSEEDFLPKAGWWGGRERRNCISYPLPYQACLRPAYLLFFNVCMRYPSTYLPTYLSFFLRTWLIYFSAVPLLICTFWNNLNVKCLKVRQWEPVFISGKTLLLLADALRKGIVLDIIHLNSFATYLYLNIPLP